MSDILKSEFTKAEESAWRIITKNLFEVTDSYDYGFETAKQVMARNIIFSLREADIELKTIEGDKS